MEWESKQGAHDNNTPAQSFVEIRDMHL